MDAVDRAIINNLQGGFPVVEQPFAAVSATLGISEEDLISRIDNLLAQDMLTRFGPMYHAERLGGALTLAAMKIPPDEFDRVAGIVNGFPEVAHNYARDHAFNMWFVLATETPEEIGRVLARIEHKTGHIVHNMPKIEEFFVGLRFEA